MAGRSFLRAESTSEARVWRLESGVWSLEAGGWRLEPEAIPTSVRKRYLPAQIVEPVEDHMDCRRIGAGGLLEHQEWESGDLAIGSSAIFTAFRAATCHQLVGLDASDF